jgi:pimeloyl-ACP methyl ester carboxylesterase
MSITTAHADVNDTQIHYAIAGEGPAVVLLHGWPFTWMLWRPLMPLLADAGFTVIAPDLRGLGNSRRELDGYEKDNVAQDIRELAEQLGFEEIDLVGVDIGTMVALSYAIDTPDRVRHLVLAESLLPGFGLEELMNPATGGFWHFGFHMQVDLATMLTTGREEAYLRPGWDQFSRGLSEADKDELVGQYTAPGAMRAGFSHYAPLVSDGQRNRERLTHRLEMPVLVLNGDSGLPQAPLLAGARQVAAHVQTDIVPAAGHTLATDNPEWLAQRLTAFFAPTGMGAAH